jgi:cytochrome P450
LTRADVFKVPFGEEMARLNDGAAPGHGTPFLLGIDDPLEHDKRARCLMARLGLDDIAAVEEMAFQAAKSRLLLQAAKSFEAINGLVTAVPIDLCNRYFGLSITDGEARSFADASIELSGHLFGAPPKSKDDPLKGIGPSKDGQENEAGDYVRCFVNRAIKAAKAQPPLAAGQAPETLATKLRGLSDKEARAILMGMIVGFVPTNTLAGGYMLEVLLSKPDAMKAAVEAAQAGDDDRLCACLFEALRLRPINLGPFRICKGGYQLDGSFIRHGERVWVMTGSAMWDSRKVLKASHFDPLRPASSYLHFGFGMHWCIGAMLARAQLTQTFKALLLHGAPKPVSRLGYRGTFPAYLKIAIKR